MQKFNFGVTIFIRYHQKIILIFIIFDFLNFVLSHDYRFFPIYLKIYFRSRTHIDS